MSLASTVKQVITDRPKLVAAFAAISYPPRASRFALSRKMRRMTLPVVVSGMEFDEFDLTRIFVR